MPHPEACPPAHIYSKKNLTALILSSLSLPQPLGCAGPCYPISSVCRCLAGRQALPGAPGGGQGKKLAVFKPHPAPCLGKPRDRGDGIAGSCTSQRWRQGRLNRETERAVWVWGESEMRQQQHRNGAGEVGSAATAPPSLPPGAVAPVAPPKSQASIC